MRGGDAGNQDESENEISVVSVFFPVTLVCHTHEDRVRVWSVRGSNRSMLPFDRQECKSYLSPCPRVLLVFDLRKKKGEMKDKRKRRRLKIGDDDQRLCMHARIILTMSQQQHLMP